MNSTPRQESASLPASSSPTDGGTSQWGCPRCTLLNPVTSQTCEVCGFARSAQTRLGAEETTDVSVSQLLVHHARQERKFMIRFEPLHPLVANNVFGSTTSIASSSLIGGLVGGPMGAIVGAAGAVVLDGANRLSHHFRRDQSDQQQRRQIVITKIRMDGSAMSITMKTMTRCRKMVVQPMIVRASRDGSTTESIPDDAYWTQLTPRDQRMLQILFLHLLSDSSIEEGHEMDVSYEELLERVVGTSQNAKKGATQEEIEAHSEIVTLATAADVAELKEHQKVCNICLEDFKEGDQIRTLNSCSHVYHPKCIDEWMHKVASCPVCKSDLHVHHDDGDDDDDGHNEDQDNIATVEHQS